MQTPLRWPSVILLGVLLLVGCARPGTTPTPTAVRTPAPTVAPPRTPTPTIVLTPAPTVSPTRTPTASPTAGPVSDEELSYSRRTPFVPLDDPVFLGAGEAAYLADDELVLALEWEG